MPTILRARPLPPGTDIRRSLMLNQPQPVTQAKPKVRPRVEPVAGPPRIIIREVPPAPRQSSVTPSGASPHAVPWLELKDLTHSGNRIMDVRDIVAYPDDPADLMRTEDGSPITAVRFLDPLGNPVAMGVEGLPGPPGPPGEDSTVPGPPGPPGEVPEAPLDGQQYARQSAAWSVVTPPDTTTDWSEITGKPSTFPPTVPIAWTDVSGKPATFPPTVPIAWDDITGEPTTFPPTIPTGGGIAAWPYLPLAGGTLTGPLQGTLATFTVNANSDQAVLRIENASAGAAAVSTFTQVVGGTKFVNRRVSWTANYLHETGAGGITMRYSDFDTHTFRKNDGTALATLNATDLALTNVRFRTTVADTAQAMLLSGATKGIRIVPTATYSVIEGVDNTGTGSYQPLRLFGSRVDVPITPPVGTNDTQIANTAFVTTAVAASSGVPPGSIIDFAGDTVPTGWLICDGSSKLVATYPALHAAIAYKYGGSGANFNVPDLGGRVTAGKEATAGGVRLTVAGSGIDGSVVGAAGGGQTHALTLAQIAAHAHTSTSAAVLFANVGTAFGYTQPTAATYVGYGSLATDTQGSGTAHQNTQPTMVMNKIIKT